MDGEGAALARLRFDRNRAAVCFDNMLDQRQTQAGTLDVVHQAGADAVESFEDTFQFIARYADPVVRDRQRLKRLFGFDYTVEMFVPAAKRVWGYYVFPLLEGDRFVGRVEVKADRKSGNLRVLNLWWEPKTKQTSPRMTKLEAELSRMQRFVGLEHVIWETAPP